MSSEFRSTLQTDLARSLYDWSNLRKRDMRSEIQEEIARSFCTREGFEFVRMQESGSEWPFVEVRGEERLDAYRQWGTSFYVHGYGAPILIFQEN